MPWPIRQTALRERLYTGDWSAAISRWRTYPAPRVPNQQLEPLSPPISAGLRSRLLTAGATSIDPCRGSFAVRKAVKPTGYTRSIQNDSGLPKDLPAGLR
jgi:hypothetical protein